jgi:cytochrome c556
MKLWKCAATLATVLALAAPAWAQGDVIAARRDGLKGVARQMDGIKAVIDQRGDPRTTGASIADMIGFFEGFPARFPAGSGTGDTRALPAIWTDRAGFETANTNMVTSFAPCKRRQIQATKLPLVPLFSKPGRLAAPAIAPIAAPPGKRAGLIRLGWGQCASKEADKQEYRCPSQNQQTECEPP